MVLTVRYQHFCLSFSFPTLYLLWWQIVSHNQLFLRIIYAPAGPRTHSKRYWRWITGHVLHNHLGIDQEGPFLVGVIMTKEISLQVNVLQWVICFKSLAEFIRAEGISHSDDILKCMDQYHCALYLSELAYQFWYGCSLCWPWSSPLSIGCLKYPF